MSRSKEALERGIELFRSLLGRHPAVEEEFARTRGWFAGLPPGVPDPDRILKDELASRRHLEWFLLEHPSEDLGGVPATVLREEWLEVADDAEVEYAEAFVNSQSGAFEVTAVDRAQGVWLRDLFGAGEYPIEEPEAAAEIEEGDLVVGRIFPVGDGIFRMSPAAACFRDPELREAVRADAARMRRERRGVLRIEQLELERLFFGAPGTMQPTMANPGRRASRLLTSAGLSESRVTDLLADVERAAHQGDGTRITEVLNELAFETEIDLETLRFALVEYWNEHAAAVSTEAPEGPGADPIPTQGEQAVRAALAAFDSGRAAGRDLDELFRELEHDLGCAAEGEVSKPADAAPIPDLGDAEIPDFPWAVGAMVEEFFWERERGPGPGLPEGHRILELLAEYGKRIGVFENLSPRDLLDFAGRWVLDGGRLADGDAARALLAALREFCLWCDNEHAVPLSEGFAPLCAELEESLPRLAELGGHLADRDGGPYAPFHVEAIEDELVVLVDPDDVEHRVRLAPAIRAALRPGDIVQARLAADEATLAAVYPSVIERLRAR